MSKPPPPPLPLSSRSRKPPKPPSIPKPEGRNLSTKELEVIAKQRQLAATIKKSIEQESINVIDLTAGIDFNDNAYIGELAHKTIQSKSIIPKIQSKSIISNSGKIESPATAVDPNKVQLNNKRPRSNSKTLSDLLTKIPSSPLHNCYDDETKKDSQILSNLISKVGKVNNDDGSTSSKDISSQLSKEQQQQHLRPSRSSKRVTKITPNNGTTTNKNSHTNFQSLSSSSTRFSTSSLLAAKGVSSSHLLQKIEDIDDGVEVIQIEDYFQNIRDWDFFADWNNQQLQSSKPQKSSSSEKKHMKRKRVHRDGDSKGVYDDSDEDSLDSNDKKTSTLSTNTAIDSDLKEVPTTFLTRKQYQLRWKPLCLAEAKAQILSDVTSDVPYWNKNSNDIYSNNLSTSTHSHESNNKGGNYKGPIPISAKCHIKDVGSDSDSMTIIIDPRKNMNVKNGPSFYTNDVVIISINEENFQSAYKGKLVTTNPNDKSYMSNNLSTLTMNQLHGMVGHVEYSRRQLENLQVKVSRKFWQNICQRGNSEKLYLLNAGSNVTAIREYSALCRAGSLPLLPYLLGKNIVNSTNKTTTDTNVNNKQTNKRSKSEIGNPNYPNKDEIKSSKDTKNAFLESMGGKSALGQGFSKYAYDKFNASQLRAISAAATEYGQGGFTLVKGPPGTGKTTTLVALLNALHIRQFNQYFEDVRKIAQASTSSTGAKRMALAEAAKKKPRLLVAAPSNNAVDNILRKIMEDGFIDGAGCRYFPSVVRVGVGQSSSVKDVSLESKVNTLIDEACDVAKLDSILGTFKADLSRIHGDIQKLRRRLQALHDASPYPLCKDWEIRIDNNFDENGKVYFVNHKEMKTSYDCPPPPEPDEKYYSATAMPEYRSFVSQLVKLIERYNNTNNKIERCTLQRDANITTSQNRNSQAVEALRSQLETHILDSTHIVTTTLGTAGCRALESSMKFEVVVIDEAAQSVEPATLAALQLGSSHAILVGDPQQLPATIFSMSGRNTKYDRSLFQRLEEAGHEVHMLNTQYRMHPDISFFPRTIFYGGDLKDGKNVEHPEYGNPIRRLIYNKFKAFHPFTMFDLDSTEERGGTSLTNTTEARFALHLYQSLMTEVGEQCSKSKVCIITPYSQQASLLRRIFSEALGVNYEKSVEVNTVDAFQGRESNIVIFSCVRAAGKSKGIGFLSDVRRMNVALTRAKFFLFVIARCDSIVVNPFWKDLVRHAREANSLFRITMRGKNNFMDLSNLKSPHPPSDPSKSGMEKKAVPSKSKEVDKQSGQPKISKKKKKVAQLSDIEEGEID